ncbi:MAG: 50S ribosomal protein L6 [Candidatus Micrarchaeales archaeon]|jgi:Ribosomal protein L6P/L9E|uniref:50S ribosomal protein L6 n=1 Tax=Candidatus Micrarchaeum acidiphilum ARMAN-2 TaxID=425595 RepID=C7DIU3_MICA2|nr:MAG: ribosomal protein L6 [Candidatus Micrarchaeum acidiphilum ARMAN-2]MCW6161309.1 50S ribosomal protein L6 [Candidatus Micrarchaeales archaeon]
MAEIEIPKDVNVSVEGNTVTVKGKLGSNTRPFNDALLSVAINQGRLKIESVKSNKKLAKKAQNAITSFSKEVQTDMKGTNEYFEVRMEAISAHFPMSLETKGDTLLIKNIFGERAPRPAKIAGSTKVEIKDKALRIYGTKLEDVMQTSANIRKACKARNKDERIFQDGIYYSLN